MLQWVSLTRRPRVTMSRRQRARLYNASQKGVARNLRSEHGMERDESLYWASVLLHPDSRCAICGLPNRMLKLYVQRGASWFLGRASGAGSHAHLTLDHISPGRLEGGFRPLCNACNSTRGANQLTDEEVLEIIRGKWFWTIGLRFLWWLNTTPGQGGRLHRSKRCATRDVRFVESAGLPVPSPQQQTGS